MSDKIQGAAAKNVREILRARAQVLAQTPASAPAGHTSLEVLEFRLGRERYALETQYVREVYPLKNLTPLPCTPPFVLGVVNLRGRILPVLDLKQLFGLQDNGLTDLHRVIVVGDDEMELGVLADLDVDVRSVPVESVQAPMPTLSGIGTEYLKGVTAERLVVLDMGRILADPKIAVHEEADN